MVQRQLDGGLGCGESLGSGRPAEAEPSALTCQRTSTFASLQEDLTKETLHKQYQLVKSHTNTSHVMQYGNKVRRAAWPPRGFPSLRLTRLERRSLGEETWGPRGEMAEAAMSLPLRANCILGPVPGLWSRTLPGSNSQSCEIRGELLSFAESPFPPWSEPQCTIKEGHAPKALNRAGTH